MRPSGAEKDWKNGEIDIMGDISQQKMTFAFSGTANVTKMNNTFVTAQCHGRIKKGCAGDYDDPGML